MDDWVELFGSDHDLHDFDDVLGAGAALQEVDQDVLADWLAGFLVALLDVVVEVFHCAGIYAHGHPLEYDWDEVLDLEQPLHRLGDAAGGDAEGVVLGEGSDH